VAAPEGAGNSAVPGLGNPRRSGAGRLRHPNASITRFILGWLQFFTFTQYFDLPP
jgi:hypothetical protein